MKIIAHREKPFPEDLKGRLNAILNIVNVELKSLTLLHLDDVPAGSREIRHRIRETVRGGYLPHHFCFLQYCHNTLFPIGAVAEEDIIYEDGEDFVTGYRITEAGKKYGRPIAYFTLDYAVRNNMSMFEILGSTASRGASRAPINRVGILESLRKGNKREVDLEHEISLHETGVREHIEILKEKGLVDYSSFGEMGKEKINYVWTRNKAVSQVETVSGFTNLTIKIAKKMEELKESNCYELSRILEYKAVCDISRILAGLERQGIVACKSKWKFGERLSETRLLSRGEKFLEEYIDKVKCALNDGPNLRKMSLFANRLINDSDEFCRISERAVELYKKVSPHINKKSKEETFERIIKYLTRNPGARPNKILKDLSISAISPYITPLVKSGQLRKEQHGRKTRYYVNG